MNQDKRLANVKKIAILRANALGDFLVTLPAIKAIKLTYPEAEIVLLGKPWHKEFLSKKRCGVDRVVVVPVMKGIRNEEGQTEDPQEVEAFIGKMEAEKFDIAISFQGSGVSAVPFLKKLKARVMIANTSDHSEKPDRWVAYYYYQSEVLRYLELASLIGATTAEVEPEIALLDQDLSEAERCMVLWGQKPFVVINPIATDIRRTWPLESYPALASRLIEKGFDIVWSGSDADREKVEGIVSQIPIATFNTCGQLTLGGLAALLSKASLFIGPDTGPLHLARAVNTPTVGIYWAPNMINWGPLTREKHRPVVSWDLVCPHCGIVPNDPYPFEPQMGCKHLVSFVRDVTVDQVMLEAAKVWRGVESTPPFLNRVNQNFLKTTA